MAAVRLWWPSEYTLFTLWASIISAIVHIICIGVSPTPLPILSSNCVCVCNLCFFATWPHFAVFYCYVFGADHGWRGSRPCRAGHNVVMTDAAIKDNYDSGNRFYFRVYLLCSCAHNQTREPRARSLPKNWRHVCAPCCCGCRWHKGRPLPPRLTPSVQMAGSIYIYFSGDQRGIEIMRIIRAALQRLAKKLYPRHKKLTSFYAFDKLQAV